MPLALVTVKMLPFDNKSEFQVIVDMPEGTALEQTARVSAELAHEALNDADVSSTCRATSAPSSPYNFNGLVRHYFLRRAPHLADLQVNLLPKDERSEQSHDIAKRRPASASCRSRGGSAPRSRCRKCRPGRRCCRRSSPKSTGRTVAAAGARAAR